MIKYKITTCASANAIGAVPAPPVRLVRFSPDHFWPCPIQFVLEYPNQPDHFSL